jgi:SNF2-related domain/Helicase conserved C-terminal domain
MTTAIKDSRSGIDPANLDEILSAASSVGEALQTGAAQYQTPTELAELCNSLLPAVPNLAFDPQVASGHTVRAGLPHWVKKVGFEIDNRFRAAVEDGVSGFHDDVTRVTGNCVKAWEILDDLFPDLTFQCQNANPPFGLKWETPTGSRVDSTEYTWRKIMERAAVNGFGYFIAASKTIERLGIHNHERVYLYQKFPSGVWKNTTVEVGIVHWHASRQHPEKKTLVYSLCGTPEKPLFPNLREHFGELSTIREYYRSHPTPASPTGHSLAAVTTAVFNQIQAILTEEAKKRPPFNIWLHHNGRLKVYISQRLTHKRKLSGDEIKRVFLVNDYHPLTLTADRETRKLLAELVQAGVYTIEPAAKEAIESALREVEIIAQPIMPCTKFEKVAYCDEEDEIECIADFQFPYPHGTAIAFKRGRKYPLTTSTYNFVQRFTRKKLKQDEETGQPYTAEHRCTLSGIDRFISIKDDNGTVHRFMDRPEQGRPDHDEATLFQIFQEPEVKTVAESHAALIEANLLTLELCEQMADYTYYPGQRFYLARVATKDYGLIGAATGAGKSLFVLSLIQMKAPARALIVAPQGTMRASEDEDAEEGDEFQASQWVTEIRRYAPGLAVFELFSLEDYHRILKCNNGILPCGIYITYYEAFFTNGARETCPPTWNDERLARECGNILERECVLPEVPEDADPNKYWSESLGQEGGPKSKDSGIRCIMQPCMSTLIGHLFDFVALDEAHKISNLETGLCQMAMRLQPRYRYLLTATPIPNIISNLFAPMGWLCVPDWYKGGRLNAAWPFARHEIGRFNTMFLSEERDFTEEENKRAADRLWKGKCVKTSPIISSPARLLKLLKPTMAYISKKACNPNVLPPIRTEIRVPFGRQQSTLYAHFQNRANIPASHPLVRARKQVAYLRAICADPAGFLHGGPKVFSNWNPKTIALMQLTQTLLAKGQQLVIVNARVGQTSTYARLLAEAGIPIARIDSTIPADQASWQANQFKRGEARVLLMGMRCAMGYSFPDCENLIVGSLEYSPGPLEQTEGRIDRVNSKRQPKIWCILNQNSIEELQYDVVATKDDSAKLCLHGMRVPREYVPVDAAEVMALAYINWQKSEGTEYKTEFECESEWPTLCAALKKI